MFSVGLDVSGEDTPSAKSLASRSSRARIRIVSEKPGALWRFPCLDGPLRNQINPIFKRGNFFPKIGGTEWSRPPSNKHQDGAQLTAGWMNSRRLRSKTVSFPAAFWTHCRMLSLAQSGRATRQSGRAVEPYLSALET